MGLSAALAALRKAITDSINAAGITQKGQVIFGWPTAPQLVEILGQPDVEWQISIYPLRASNVTRYIGESAVVGRPIVNLTRTINGATITFAGSATPPVNVHSFLADLNEDVYIRTQPGQSPDDVADSVATAVNDLALPDVSASATGPAVTLDGATWEFCNIGGVGTVTTGEQLRTSRIVQVTVWTTGDTSDADIDNPMRLTLYDAITSRLGTVGQHFLTLPDGSSAYVAFAGDDFDDDSSSSYSLYAAHIRFEFEYAVFLQTPATQVGDIAVTQSINGQEAGTTYIGG